MIPQSLADAQANLLAVPRPVIFLDTCDVVNLLQVVTSVPVTELKAGIRCVSTRRSVKRAAVNALARALLWVGNQP